MLCYIYTVLIKWLVAYKSDYRSHIKQVIISCEFCQHFNCLEVALSSWISLWHLNILHIYCLIKWLVVYKCDYRSQIKQVIISCEFCQRFSCLEVVLSSWMSMWRLNILGTWIEVLNQFENLFF